MNRNTYLFSVIAAVFLPTSFLTGLLGVNVGGIPGSDNPIAFTFFCVVMIGIFIAEYWILRKLDFSNNLNDGDVLTNYIFGYGSLMNSCSRQLTGQTGHTAPAIVSGLIRYWGKLDTSLTASPLVVDVGEGQVNGVLLEITSDDLSQFDQREHGYQRHQLSITQIDTKHPLDNNDKIWVYIKSEPHTPYSNAPVLQTYIDTVLEGCLDVSEEFAKFFIEHTEGWNHPIENDREKPRYINYAGVDKQKLSKIDQLLRKVMSL